MLEGWVRGAWRRSRCIGRCGVARHCARVPRRSRDLGATHDDAWHPSTSNPARMAGGHAARGRALHARTARLAAGRSSAGRTGRSCRPQPLRLVARTIEGPAVVPPPTACATCWRPSASARSRRPHPSARPRHPRCCTAGIRVSACAADVDDLDCTVHDPRAGQGRRARGAIRRPRRGRVGAYTPRPVLLARVAEPWRSSWVLGRAWAAHHLRAGARVLGPVVGSEHVGPRGAAFRRHPPLEAVPICAPCRNAQAREPRHRRSACLGSDSPPLSPRAPAGLTRSAGANPGPALAPGSVDRRSTSAAQRQQDGAR